MNAKQTKKQTEQYRKCYNNAKKQMHICTPLQYELYKELMNYYYKKII